MWRRAIKTLTLTPAPRWSLVPLAPRCFSFSAESDSKRVDDVTPIKTGHEGKDIRNVYYYRKKEHRENNTDRFPGIVLRNNEPPVVVESYYDRRIVGCSCGLDEDDFGFLYFRLFKGKPEACRLCKQRFELDVVGPGTPP